MSIESAIIQTEYAHVVREPGIVGGEPHIAGHRIRIRDITAARDRGGYTPEEIAANVYPHLTLAEVYAALAYYEDHRSEIDQQTEAESHFIDHFMQQHPELVHHAGID